ncbi:hypothetical protein TVAG_490360 [Trichomonas vaginalis G3]|uniref:DUF3447 domain-containing protein n=1 Tax=Trichomonas vaginalis (strain ATCC PRA-98 / G3) TaxID=412133 RepID=A2F0X3_TRIV3|nr:protein ubiquitination [Trichomonas vaginalis G3]EAY01448.1 hypothetical protein TVAG_490360 [Trichomonas vaginalis G3]KAI5519259.1 protein ubiquitination [Trichomonas vaginalis G3]|eukprot:XP_001314152.1 hypothetical protein [Trichomonas vaginalis G3]
MSGSEKQTNEIECNFMDLKPIEVLKYPSQASHIIWYLDSNYILQESTKIVDFINENKISVQMAIYLIDIFSQIRVKDIKLFTEFYQMISNEFSYITKPKNEKLATLLYYNGFEFENFEPKMEEEDILNLISTEFPFYNSEWDEIDDHKCKSLNLDFILKEEKILNLYSTESPLYYIAWDKVDDLKCKFPNLNFDKEIDGEFTPLDCAIFYGSELCFNYLKNLGAKYTDNSEKYAVQGGNTNIFMQMIEDGKSFDNMINTALAYRHFEIAEYLKSNFGQSPNSIAESMYYGNFDIASYLLSNGANINDVYILFLFIFVIVLWNFISFQIYRCLIIFSLY